jgi:glycosyltransferase involved in cell wall biosynthesis
MQTYPHFKVCVYDNASGDNTAAVVNEIVKADPRVKYYCHPKNIGAAANFNFGMERTNTPYFSLLADDNTLLPHFFEHAIPSLEKHKSAILFAGQTIRIDEKGRRIAGSLDSWDDGLIEPTEAFMNILEKGIPNWEAVIYRSQVIKEVGLLKPEYSGAIDQDFMMRIARHHRFYVSKRECAQFLVHRDSWTLIRDLSEAIATLKKRLEPWLNDDGLPDFVKLCIVNALKTKTRNTLTTFVYHKCVLGRDEETFFAAKECMKEDLDFSLRLFILMLSARMARNSNFLKKLLSGAHDLYLWFRYCHMFRVNKDLITRRS